MPRATPTIRTRCPLISARPPIGTPSLGRSAPSTITAKGSFNDARCAGVNTSEKIMPSAPVLMPDTNTDTPPVPAGPRQSPSIHANGSTRAMPGSISSAVRARGPMGRPSSMLWVPGYPTHRSASEAVMYTAVDPKMPNTSAACINSSKPENATASIAGRKRRHSWTRVLRARGITAGVFEFFQLPFALSVARAVSGVEVHPSTPALQACAQGERLPAASWSGLPMWRSGSVNRRGRQRRATERLVQGHVRQSVREPRLLPPQFGIRGCDPRVNQLQFVGLAQPLQFFAQIQRPPRSRGRRIRALQPRFRCVQHRQVGFDFGGALQHRLPVRKQRGLQLCIARIAHRAALAPIEQRNIDDRTDGGRVVDVPQLGLALYQRREGQRTAQHEVRIQ